MPQAKRTDAKKTWFEQIRESGSGVPILSSSGPSPDPGDTEFLICNGPRLIQKPYSPNELFASVREVLDLSPARAPRRALLIPLHALPRFCTGL